jgi:transposase
MIFAAGFPFEIGETEPLPMSDFVHNPRLFRRAQIISLHRHGIRPAQIARFADCAMSTVSRWTGRSDTENLMDNPRPGQVPVFDETLQLRLIGFYCQERPLSGRGRWTLRWAAKYLKENPTHLGVIPSASSIHRILKKHNLKPHQSKYFLHISDPDFFPKLDHLLELFASLPDRLWFFDECPGIQILTRIAPDISTGNKQRWLREFEYNRNGTIDVMAFLEAKTGKVSAKCTFDHKSETFNEVFEEHVSKQPENARLDYVMDNLSTHCNDVFVKLVAKLSNVACPTLENGNERRKWLQSTDKRIVIHFTPFHGSWLNRVEIWFGILNQKCLNESYNSYESMMDAIYEFVEIWNTLLAHPFKFNYDGADLHQKAVRRFMRILENQCRAPLPIKFLIKQLLIMANLINTYSNKVDFKVWVELDQLLGSRKAHLKELIELDDKPKRQQKAHEALEKLLTISSDYLKKERIAQKERPKNEEEERKIAA